MNPGQLSNALFCPACGAPAIARRSSALTEPLRCHWSTSCAHAATPTPMSAIQANLLTQTYAAERSIDSRVYIATCTGEPI
jgi:hypothetical protein